MAASTPAPVPASQPARAPAQPTAHWPWLKYATPILVLLLGSGTFAISASRVVLERVQAQRFVQASAYW